jgi:hypothetical protein
MAKLVVMERKEKEKLNHPGGEAVLAKVDGKGAGLPFFAFLDAKGELIVNSMRPTPGHPGGSNIGHPFAPEEIDWFMTMLQKAAPGLTVAERKTIEDWLRSQKKP